MSQIDATLNERGRRYGDFDGHATITQAIKEAMKDTPNWGVLADDQKEALEMTAHKIGRILNGDPDYVDSWHDIIGYVRLVEQRLVQREQQVEKMNAEIGATLGKSPAAQQAVQQKAPEPERCLDCGQVHEGAVTRSHIEHILRSAGLPPDTKIVFVDDSIET